MKRKGKRLAALALAVMMTFSQGSFGNLSGGGLAGVQAAGETGGQDIVIIDSDGQAEDGLSDMDAAGSDVAGLMLMDDGDEPSDGGAEDPSDEVALDADEDDSEGVSDTGSEFEDDSDGTSLSERESDANSDEEAGNSAREDPGEEVNDADSGEEGSGDDAEASYINAAENPDEDSNHDDGEGYELNADNADADNADGEDANAADADNEGLEEDVNSNQEEAEAADSDSDDSGSEEKADDADNVGAEDNSIANADKEIGEDGEEDSENVEGAEASEVEDANDAAEDAGEAENTDSADEAGNPDASEDAGEAREADADENDASENEKGVAAENDVDGQDADSEDDLDSAGDVSDAEGVSDAVDAEVTDDAGEAVDSDSTENAEDVAGDADDADAAGNAGSADNTDDNEDFEESQDSEAEDGEQEDDYGSALVISEKTVEALSEGAATATGREEAADSLLGEDDGEEEASLQELSEFSAGEEGYSYNYDESSHTLTISLSNDFNEDLVVLDTFREGDEGRLTVELDLNGHTLRPKGKKNNTGITVFGKLVVMDSSEGKTGKIDGAGLSQVRGIEVAARGELWLMGGTVCNFSTKGNGGGITVNEGGKLILAGGRVSGNKASENGGGIFAYSAKSVTFDTENGGKSVVSNNEAKNGGGIAFAVFSEDDADYDDMEKASWSMDGLVLYGNRATVNGGGVYFDAKVDVSVKGSALISGNTAKKNGGGMYFYAQASALRLKNGGRIAGNTAEEENGGGVYMNGLDSVFYLGEGGLLGAPTNTTIDAEGQWRKAEKTAAEEKASSAGTGSDIAEAVASGVPEVDEDDLSGAEYGADAYSDHDDLSDIEAAELLALRGNLAELGKGGGIYINWRSRIEAAGGKISGNRAYIDGGGFYLYSENNYFSQLRLENAIIENNVLGDYLNGNRHGAGGYMYRYMKLIEIENTLFRNNRGASHGGGFYVDYYTGSGDVTVTSVSISKSVFKGNHIEAVPTGGAGAGLYIHESGRGRVVISDSLFTGNMSDTAGCYAGGGYIYRNAATIERCEFLNNRTGGSGAGFCTDQWASYTERDVILEDCLFENNISYWERRGYSGAGFYQGGGISLTVKGKNIFRNNYCSSEGGGIYASPTDTYLESGTQIYNNQSNGYGGGGRFGRLHITNGVEFKTNVSKSHGGGFFAGSLFMDGGIVTENSSNNYGGGFWVSGLVEMSGGEISGNTAISGGGVVLDNPNDSILSGGRIVNNTASSNGGGIYAFCGNSGTHFLTLKGNVEISGNTATSGGGIYTYYRPHILVEENATIINNEANNGGGIFLDWPGDNSEEPAYPWGIHVNGGTLRDNHARSWGNDLYARSYWSGENAYRRTSYRLEEPGEGGAWYDEKNQVYIQEAVDNQAENEELRALDTDPVSPTRKDVYNYFTYKDYDGFVAENVKTGKKYVSVQAAVSDEMTELEEGVRSVRMLLDSMENVSISAGYPVILDLNGKSLRAPRLGSVITVEKEAVFTLQDNSVEQSGKVTDGKGTGIVLPEGLTYQWPTWRYGGGVYVRDGAKFYLEGGSITNNNADHGAGVYLSDEAEMLMTGGSVSGNSGIGVYVYCGYEKDRDPEKGSNYPSKGFNYWNLGATFTMESGEISKNTGRGIYITSASRVFLKGGKISGNAGGIRTDVIRVNRNNERLPNLVMTGGEISGNRAYDHGMGIYLYDQGRAEISGGVIRDNYAHNNGYLGGGIYVTTNYSGLTLSGNVLITDNGAGYGGGIYYNTSSSESYLRMEGGAVYGNRSMLGTGMRGSDIFLVQNSKNVVLQDASDMGSEDYNCWLDEVTFGKYLTLSQDIPDMTAKLAEGILCLQAIKDHEIKGAARIGEKSYNTLQAAVNEAEDGDVIYLLKNLEESVLLNQPKSLTVDLNGYELKGAKQQVFYLDKVLGTLTLRSTIEEDDANREKADDNQENYVKVNKGRILSPDGADMRAIHINGGHVVLDGIKISGFHSSGSGGAVYVNSNTTRVNNVSTYYDASFTMKGKSVIEDCSADSEGGAIYADLYNDGNWNGSATSVVIEDGSIIQNCTALSHGGAMRVHFDRFIRSDAMADELDDDGNPVLDEEGNPKQKSKGNQLLIHGGSLFTGNKSVNQYGGAIYVTGYNNWNNYMNTPLSYRDDIRIYDTTITGNTAIYGGGLTLYCGFMHIGKEGYETVVSNNRAMEEDGGIRITGSNTHTKVWLTDLTVTGNKAKNYGGIHATVPIEMKGCLIEENEANMLDGWCGGLYVSGAKNFDGVKNGLVKYYKDNVTSFVSMDDMPGEMTEEEKKQEALEIAEGMAEDYFEELKAALTTLVEDTDILNNRAVNAGGLRFQIVPDGTVFRRVKINDNYTVSSGGGIMGGYYSSDYEKGAVLLFDQCEFKGNEASDGAVLCTQLATLTIEFRDCEISGNIARNSNATGGLYLGSWNVNMSDPETVPGLILSGSTAIKDNTGRGVYITRFRTIMKDQVEISGNHLKSGTGGGLFQDSGSLAITGGTISGNTAVDGGGLYVYNEQNEAFKELFEQYIDGKDVRIEKNTATGSGAGILLGNYTVFELRQGTVTENTAAANGGGVYVNYSKSHFILSGGKLYDNHANLGQDVYDSYNSSYRTSQVTLIRASDMFLDEAGTDQARTGIAWIDERNDNLYYDEVKGIMPYALPLTLNYKTAKPAAAVRNLEGGLYTVYNSVQEAIEAILSGKHGEFTGQEKPEIILVDDVTENVQIPGEADVVLNLNGFTLLGNGSSAISCSGDVRIVDEKKTGENAVNNGVKVYPAKEGAIGTITGTAGQAGGGVHVTNGGNATLSSGQIANCRAGGVSNSWSYGGGAVCIDAGTFTLEKDGALRGNRTNYYGGAVLIRNTSGKFVMTGGVIEDNTVVNNHGIIANNTGKVAISGGVIRNNLVGSSGIICNVGNGTVNIGGPDEEHKVQIINNTAKVRGGAISMDDGKVYLSNVLMQGNTVTYARQASGNAVAGSGGAIYQGGGTLYINEGTEVRGNKASRGGGIYQNGGTAYMMGGLITENIADIGGGIAQYPLNNMTFMVSRGEVAGNFTTLYGSGNDIYSWYEGTQYDFSHPELITNKPKFTIMAAMLMGKEEYNAWKDDTYKGSNRTAPVISNSENASVGGQYITGSILSSCNLQLTAAFYETPVDDEFDSDVYIEDFHLESENYGSGITDGTVTWAENKPEQLARRDEIAAKEKRAKDMAGQEGWELVSDGEHAGMYLHDGKYYEPDQMAEWDAGYDSSTNNLLVRSYDSFTYSFLLSIAPKKGAASGKTRKVHPWVEIELPCDVTEAEFEESSLTEVFKGTPSYSIRTVDGVTYQKVSGYWVHEMTDAGSVMRSFTIRIYAMKNGDTLRPRFRAWIEGNEANDTGAVVQNASEQESAALAEAEEEAAAAFAELNGSGNAENAANAENGESAALMGDEEDNTNNNNENNGGSGAGGSGTSAASAQRPVTEFYSPVITISAIPKYNAAIDYNSELAYDGYFDLKNGVEVSEEDYKNAKKEGNTDIIHGMMVGYGVMVSLYNDVIDGLKGIELPEKSLEFDLSFKGKLYYNGSPLFPDGSENADKAEGAPYIWAYKENMDTPMGKQLGDDSVYNRTMDWNDEDDLVKTTRYAFNAAPYNSGGNKRSNSNNSCFSGGSWKITGQQPAYGEKETTLHVSVSNYVLNGDKDPNKNAYPNRNSADVEDPRFKTPQVKPFTAGYIQVVYPYDDDDIKAAFRAEYGVGIQGYLSVAMEAAVSHFSAKGRSGVDAVSYDDSDGLKAMNTYYDLADPENLYNTVREGETLPLANCEMRYGDNYSFNDFGRYLSEGGGPASTISKTAYFLNKDRGTLTGQEGKGSTPINSVVYAGGTVGFSSNVYSTEDISRPKFYINAKDRNTLIDNYNDYDYMTAMNLLQKFDAEVYHPAYMNAYVDKAFTSNSQTNQLPDGWRMVEDKNGKVSKETVKVPIQVVTSEARAEWDGAEVQKPLNYTLTVLYAAKPDVNGEPAGNWEKIYKTDADGNVSDDGGAADMDKYHEENMLYFSTLEELEATGRTCVALLFEFRDMVIRDKRSVSVYTYLDVTDDFTKTGNTYITTNDARGWATYRRYYKEVWRRPGDANQRAQNIRNILYNYTYPSDGSYEPQPIYEDWEERMNNRVVFGMDESSEGAGDSLADRSSWERKVYKLVAVEPASSDNADGENGDGTGGTEPEGDGEDTDGSTEPEVEYEAVFDRMEVFKGYTYFMEECHKQFNGYIKTQYKNGLRQKGTHNGWDRGNVLLLYTLDTAINIGNTDIPTGSNEPQVSYNVSSGERIVNYRMDPSIALSSNATATELMKNGTQEVRVNIKVELTDNLTFRNGSVNFEYTKKNSFTADQMEWEIQVLDGGRGLMLTTYVTDVDKALPYITFACDIGDINDETKDVKTGDALEAKTTIWAEYQEINRLAAEAHTSVATNTVNKENSNVIKKDVGVILTEIGEDMVYELNYINGAEGSANIRLADVMPYFKSKNDNGGITGDSRGSEFHGAYRIRQVDVVFQDNDSYQNFIDENGNGGIRYTASGGKVPQTNTDRDKEAVKAILAKISTSAALPLEEGESVTRTYDAEKYTVSYQIDSDILTQEAGKDNGIVLYGFFPNLSGLKKVTETVENADGSTTTVEKQKKHGVTLRVICTAKSAVTETDEQGNVRHQLLKAANGETQEGGDKYINNFYFSDGDFNEEPTNILHSTDVGISVVARKITGYVWLDKSHDDRYGSGTDDSRLGKVKVELLAKQTDESYAPAVNVLGDEIAPVYTSDTAGTYGEYTFRNLGPGTYKVQISDPEKLYKSEKDWQNEQPLPFGKLGLTKLYRKNSGVDNGNRGIYAGEAEPGSNLVARTEEILMKSKEDLGSSSYTSANWNFGLYYMIPKVEKTWKNMVFAPADGTVVSFMLKGVLGDPLDSASEGSGAPEGGTGDPTGQTSEGGTGGDTGGNDDTGNEGTGATSGSSQGDTPELIYENVITMTASTNTNNRKLTVRTDNKDLAPRLSDYQGGTFEQDGPTKPQGEEYPVYVWRMKDEDVKKLPIPAVVYRDNVAYHVNYTLTESMTGGTTDKESVFTNLVTKPYSTSGSSGSEGLGDVFLHVEATNTRILSAFDFLKVDERHKTVPLTGAKFKLFKSRSDKDVVDPATADQNADGKPDGKLADSDLVQLIKLSDGTYRVKNAYETTASVTEMESGTGKNKETDDNGETVDIDSGMLGRLLVKDLPAGAYWLMESVAPDGYGLPGGYWKLTVTPGDGNEDPHHIAVRGSVQSQPKVEESDINGTSFVLPNKAGLLMARTGGSGTRRILMFGFFATAFGAAGILFARKRRRAA